MRQPAERQQSSPPGHTSPEHEYRATNLTRQPTPPLPSGDSGTAGSRRSVCGVWIPQDGIYSCDVYHVYHVFSSSCPNSLVIIMLIALCWTAVSLLSLLHVRCRHDLEAAARCRMPETHAQQLMARDEATQWERLAEAGSKSEAEPRRQQSQALPQMPWQMQQQCYPCADSSHQPSAQPAPPSQGPGVAQRYHVVVRTTSLHRGGRGAGSQTPAQLQLQMHGTRGCGEQHKLDLQDGGWAG
jgi:hypothetical protein